MGFPEISLCSFHINFLVCPPGVRGRKLVAISQCLCKAPTITWAVFWWALSSGSCQKSEIRTNFRKSHNTKHKTLIISNWVQWRETNRRLNPVKSSLTNNGLKVGNGPKILNLVFHLLLERFCRKPREESPLPKTWVFLVGGLPVASSLYGTQNQRPRSIPRPILNPERERERRKEREREKEKEDRLLSSSASSSVSIVFPQTNLHSAI